MSVRRHWKAELFFQKSSIGPVGKRLDLGPAIHSTGRTWNLDKSVIVDLLWYMVLFTYLFLWRIVRNFQR